MKQIILLLITLTLLTSVMGLNSVSINPDITIGETAPEIWLCSSSIPERNETYGFQGEIIETYVVVKNGQSSECLLMSSYSQGDTIQCNGSIVATDNSFQKYKCTTTITHSLNTEQILSYTFTNGELQTNSPPVTWIYNPILSLSINADMSFETQPGSQEDINLDIYNTGDVNTALYISGTDFYGANAVCPTSNVLELTNWRYYADNNNGDTTNGFLPIPYASSFSQSTPIINSNNILTPNNVMNLILRLNVPTPCSGHFTQGKIDIWFEAV